MKLRPDLLPIEFNEQICCDILENILNKKKDDSHLMTEKEQKLSARVSLLQEELRLALLASEDIKALKAKAVHIMEQFSRQKEQRHEAEAKKDAAEKRTGMLVGKYITNEQMLDFVCDDLAIKVLTLFFIFTML